MDRLIERLEDWAETSARVAVVLCCYAFFAVAAVAAVLLVWYGVVSWIAPS